jgi:hypothetical protein
MKKRLVLIAVAVMSMSCRRPEAVPVTPVPEAFVPQAHATLAQMMRGIPFPASNIIFDTQSEDPGVQKKGTDGARGATASFSSVYGGWQAVENNALAIAETANLLMIPGRSCENGRPVPLDREDFRKFAAGLADAGKSAYEAAQSKNLDAMADVSGTVSDACAACHEIYRDKDDVKDRCIP